MRRTRGSPAASRSWPASLALAALLSACTGQIVGEDPPAGSGADASAITPDDDAGARADANADVTAGMDAGDPADARALFADQIEPILRAARPRGACVDCHQGDDPGNGPDFLGGAADADGHRDHLIADHRLIGDSPEASLLYTTGEHTGDALCTGADAPYPGCSIDEAAAVAGWIAAEAAP